MTAPSKITIDAPAITPATGGILSAGKGINVTPSSGYELFYGVNYVPQLQGHNRPVPAPGTPKVFEQIDGSVESVPFRTYRGVDVSLMRFHGDGPSLVEEAYKGAESYGVEAKVQTLVLDDVAEDLRPGVTITNPRFALGLLEQFIRDNYSGQGVITGNALALTLIEDVLDGSGAELTTKLGTPVVLAGGYDSASTLDPDTAQLYISGQINIWRGPVTIDPASDLAGNRELALAEGQYAASVDGPVAVVLVGTN